MEHLKLIIPQLLLDPKAIPIESFASEFAVQNIEALLARSTLMQGPKAGVAGILFEHYGLCAQAERGLPSAALSRLGDGGERDGAYWLRLDPVYLHPDRDSMVMFSNEDMVINLEEAKALAREVEAHFVELNWKIEVLHPKRWYLRVDKEPPLRTHALHDVVGRHVFEYLPSGEAGRQWRVWLNEIQMLLHASPVNVARQSNAQLPINALWVWGGGRLPVVKPCACTVYGGDELAQGMAKLAEGQARRSIAGFEQLLQDHDEATTPIVILNDLEQALLARDLTRWLAQLHAWEERWFAPLRDAMKSNRLKRLSLYPGEGFLFESSAKMQRRFWRRRRSILRYYDKGQNG